MLVTVRYLELRTPDVRPPPTVRSDMTLARLLLPSVWLARRLYDDVGAESSWVSRTNWTDARWAEELARPEVEWWVCWHRNRICGFVELRGGRPPHRSTTDVKYLGLLPEFRRRGLGGALVAHATWRALRMHTRWPGLPPVLRVTVDTSEADDELALQLYQARGFAVRRTGAEDRAITPEVAARLRPSWIST